MINEKKNKEIIYNNIDRFAVIVAEGTYREMRYVCVNRGKYPCAYVMCSKEFLDMHSTDFDTLPGIDVHGGITFMGYAKDLLGLEDYDSFCFGWNYDHAGDWVGNIDEGDNKDFGNHKYTTDMLIADCTSAIDQYYAILEEDKTIQSSNPPLSGRLLKKLGFKSVFEDVSNNDDDAYKLSGERDGMKWKIFIDLQNAGKSYVMTQNPRKRYEGEIKTLTDLKDIADLFNIPIDFIG